MSFAERELSPRMYASGRGSDSPVPLWGPVVNGG